MALYNWNNGQLLTLKPGDTANCTGNLNAGQLYCLFFYNSAQNDAGATVTVVSNTSTEPLSVTVPGTTMNEGLASLVFLSGDKTSSVSASLTGSQPGAQVQCFIGSVKMPIDTNGINNKQMPTDGTVQPFAKFTRYFAVPASHWYAGQITSNINQFMSVQFREHSATVYTVNAPSKSPTPEELNIYSIGDALKHVTLTANTNQTVSFNIRGDGQQFVWINADSAQDSQTASISLQSLSSLYELHIKR